MSTAEAPTKSLSDPALKAALQELRRTDNLTNWWYIVSTYLYLALVLRELYYGVRPILWGLPWNAEAKWLPFLTVVLVLVFWRAGLYAERERRAGAGRIVSSLRMNCRRPV